MASFDPNYNGYLLGPPPRYIRNSVPGSGAGGSVYGVNPNARNILGVTTGSINNYFNIVPDFSRLRPNSIGNYSIPVPDLGINPDPYTIGAYTDIFGQNLPPAGRGAIGGIPGFGYNYYGASANASDVFLGTSNLIGSLLPPGAPSSGSALGQGVPFYDQYFSQNNGLPFYPNPPQQLNPIQQYFYGVNQDNSQYNPYGNSYQNSYQGLSYPQFGSQGLSSGGLSGPSSNGLPAWFQMGIQALMQAMGGNGTQTILGFPGFPNQQGGGCPCYGLPPQLPPWFNPPYQSCFFPPYYLSPGVPLQPLDDEGTQVRNVLSSNPNVLMPDVIPTNTPDGAAQYLKDFVAMSESDRQKIRDQFANATRVDQSILDRAGITAEGGRYNQGVVTNPFNFANFITDTNPGDKYKSGIVVTNGNGNGKVKGTKGDDILFGTKDRNNIIDAGAGGKDTVYGGNQNDLINIGEGGTVYTGPGDDLVFFDFTKATNPTNPQTTIFGNGGTDKVILTVPGNPNDDADLPRFTRLSDGTTEINFKGKRVVVSNVEQIIVTDTSGNIGSIYDVTNADPARTD